MSTPNWKVIDNAISVLNEALKLDREAVSNLLTYRVKCNAQLANHNTIQVGIVDETCMVGMMGLINGLFGIDEDGFGFISYEHENGKVICFKRTPARG